MSKGGAPKGNKNASKGKEWADALRLALKTYRNDDIKRGHALRKVAEKVVTKALDGDKDAWQELGNRLDGKPTQAIEGTGENGVIPVSVSVSFVSADKG